MPQQVRPFSNPPCSGHSSRGRRRCRNTRFPARPFETRHGDEICASRRAHRTDAVNKLEIVNAAKEIAEVERRKADQERLVIIPDALPENPANFSEEKN